MLLVSDTTGRLSPSSAMAGNRPAARPRPRTGGGTPPRRCCAQAPPAVGAAAPEGLEQVGPGTGGGVGVALDLAQRDRCGGERAVEATDGVAGVLPALVGQAVAGLVDVLQQVVAVGVAVLYQPGQRAPRAPAAAHSTWSSPRMPQRHASCRVSAHSGVASMVP